MTLLMMNLSSVPFLEVQDKFNLPSYLSDHTQENLKMVHFSCCLYFASLRATLGLGELPIQYSVPAILKL